jgi:integrase
MAYIQKRLRKNGKAAFMAVVRKSGFPMKCKTFDRYADAREWANINESNVQKEKMGTALAAKNTTVGEMITRYLDNVLESKAAKESYINIQRKQLQWWRNKLRDLRLCHLTPYIINDCKEELAGRNFSRRTPATINRYLAALNHVINTAIREWGWLEQNPITKVNKPKEPPGRTRYLLESELEALLSQCKKCERKPLYLIVLFALSTGARKSEILRLKRKDMDLVRNVAVAYDTKNGEPRQLYLSGNLSRLLADHIDKHQHRSTQWVFPANRGKSYVNIEAEWRAALKAAGVKDFRFHDLRHTSASYMAMNGASPADIAEALGHKSYDMVKRYTHLSTTHVAKVVTSMSEKFLTQQGEREASL